MHYAIFIPRGDTPVSSPEAALASVGLADLGSQGLSAIPLLGSGPDGQSGSLLWWGDPRQTPRNRHDWQWAIAPAKKTPAGELPAARYRVTWDPKAPPTPGELQRSDFLGGLEVRLEDGQDWIVPTAKVLPRRMGLDVAGELTVQIAPAFQEFCQLAEALMARLSVTDPDTGSMQLPGCWALANAALGINYRLNAELASILGLFNDRALVQVCLAVVELPLDVEWADVQKKTDIIARFSPLTPAISAGLPSETDSLANSPHGSI